MNDIGTLSAYSAYAGKYASAYDSTSVMPVEKNKEASSAENLPKPTYPKEIKDEAIISDEAQNLLKSEQSKQQDESAETSKSEKKDSDEDDNSIGKDKELTPEEEQVIAKLKDRDREVKAHEQAHIAAATGINVSAPSYDYQVGPDGKQYAIGGEVSISFTQSSDPESNIANAEAMKASALAPAAPSGQDLSVARSADEIIAKARQDLAEQNGTKSGSEETDGVGTDETSGNIANGAKDSKTETILQMA